VSDVSGGIYNDKGLDIPGLLAHSAQGKPVSEWKAANASRMTSSGRFPAMAGSPALGGVITKEANGRTIDCKVGRRRERADHADGRSDSEGSAPSRHSGLSRQCRRLTSAITSAQNLQQYR